jgi:N-acyl-phosphatidylethanolamine-hydrolysing phospholipase D
MTRRSYLRRMVQAAQAMMVWNLLAGCSLPRAGEMAAGSTKLHYRPLAGRSLRELARAKVHHGDGRFQNPFSNLERRNFTRVLRWKFFSPNEHSRYYPEEVVQPVAIDWPSIRYGRNLSVTLIKHAGLLIKDQDSYLLIDPVFGKIFWFIDDYTPLTGNLDDLPPIDQLLITHGHYDHIDRDSLARLDRNTEVLLPLGYQDIFDDLGMTNRRHLDWFDSYHGQGREIVFLPCNHWTMRNPWVGPNTGLWGSYLIRTRSGATIYLSGDTGYFDGFTELGQLYDIDLAIFNLGAYEPRWFMAPSHMNPEETYRAFRELGARHMLLAHWGTFRLGNEPVHFPPLDMARVMATDNASDRLLPLGHGETLVYG